ncbi:hypothetical protein IPA_01610 [Ignicoccus pacificus DSM 13166]|uniref:Type III-B CRISPR-associated protein Cas10/Cmr2 n=1 Tax=Ignicoccus pacificus DSM 13166 TaxID=940294 RepID=A0A977KBK4_9CREN|nr:hypothetical protein IPA_01610 [Ignicoccus pacificus DSM 13166]
MITVSSKLDKTKFFKKKIVAYLHDPFHKPWIINRSEGRWAKRVSKNCEDNCEDKNNLIYKFYEERKKKSNDKKYSRKRMHEIEAIVVIKYLFASLLSEDEIIEIIEKYTGGKSKWGYDQIASSLDRWLLTKRKRENIFNFPHLVNITNPDFLHENDKEVYPLVQKMYQFYNLLKSLLGATKCDEEDSTDCLRKKYHVLYAFAEPLWYGIVGVPPVAETRVPHHTIFDHLSATAQMVNVIWNRKWKGYMIKLKIENVQEFISNSRGPVDLWASSWLVSALMWCTIREVVEKIGPDTMLLPTARFNPFYLHMVNNKFLKGLLLDNDDDLAESTPRRESNESRSKHRSHSNYLLNPEHPVMPATATLLLPPLDIAKELLEKDITSWSEYFGEKFRGCWEKFASKIFEFVKENLHDYYNTCEENRVSCELTKEKIEEMIGNTVKVPPLPLSIVEIKLEDAWKEYEDIFKKHIENNKELNELLEKYNINEGEEKSKKGNQKDELKKKLFFHWLWANKLRRESFDAVKLDLSRLNLLGNDPKVARVECRCGLPAIIKNRSDDPIKVLKRNNGEFVINSEKGIVLIREREALCPYCLIKRILGYEWYLNLGLFESLLDAALKIKTRRSVDLLNLALSTQLEELVKRERKRNGKSTDTIKVEIEEANGKKNSTDYQLDELIEKMIQTVSLENTFLKQDTVKIVRVLDPVTRNYIIVKGDILQEIKEAILKARKYYAIIRADGDNMNLILTGKLTEDPNDKNRYFESFKKSLLSKNSSEAKRIEEIINTMKDVTRFSDVLNPEEIGARRGIPTIVVTPSYLAQISYSTMVGAVIDTALIENEYEGTTIYAGGDDLLALAPVKKLNEKGAYSPPLYIWETTRAAYWGFESESLTSFEDNEEDNKIELKDGFKKITVKIKMKGDSRELPLGALAPALIAYGRKYGIAVKHYREPLVLALRDARRLADEKGKKPTKVFPDGWVIRKDGIAIAYRNIDNSTTLPNTTFAKKKLELPLANITKKGLGLIFVKDVLSRQAFYDAAEALREFDCRTCDPNIALLFEYVVRKNMRKRNCETELWLKEVVEKLMKEHGKAYASNSDKVEMVCLPKELARFLLIWSNTLR